MDGVRQILERVRRVVLRHRRLFSAALAAIAVLLVVQQLAPAPPRRIPVVVAAHDLDSGSLLDSSDVTVVGLPPGAAPHGSARSTSAVIGHRLAGPVRAGEPLTDWRLIGATLLAGYPAGQVAAPVRIADADAVGLLRVGQRIDVYAARRDAPAADLVVGGAVVVALPTTSDEQRGGLVVLAVSAADAARLAQAEAVASLSVALRR